MNKLFPKIPMNYIFYGVLLLAIGVKLYFDAQKRNEFEDDILQNKVISKCRILDAVYFGRSNTKISYVYTVNENEYQGDYITRNISHTIAEKIRGKFMPLVYSIKNPTKSALLLRKQNFVNFKLTYPDSLNRINDYSIERNVH